MTLLHRLASILRWLFRRNRAEEELDDELRAFVELSARDKMRDGLSHAEASRQAILELGGLDQAKERVRTDRHGAWLDEIGRDVRYAVRMFARNPGFTAIVVLTLTLGIGANTAIFSLIDALMLRWLPVPNPQALLQVSLRARGDTAPGGETLSYPIVRALADRREIFSGVAGFNTMRFEVGLTEPVRRVPGAVVTGAYYETLGLSPVIGRLLTRSDDEPGALPVAVISHGYWERQHARGTDAIGRSLSVNGIPVTIVGVSPRGFVGADVGSIADLTITVSSVPQVSPEAAPLLGSGNFWLRVLARPHSGISVSQAVARLNTLWPQISEPVIAPHWPAARRKAMADSVFCLSAGGTGWTYLRQIYRKPLFVLMAVVGLVLLIACANVASLLLARASARQREIALRLAIGAGRGRIVRQLLIESVLLSSIGAAGGIVLAGVAGRSLVSLISPGTADVVFDLTPTWHVLGFTSAVAMATGLVFGMAPAFQATATQPTVALKNDTRASGSRSRLLPSLVSAQVALSLVLLAGAGLFVRTLRNLQNLDPGFAAKNVLLLDLDARRMAHPQELLDDVRRVPGVASASLSTHTPLSGSVWSEPAVPEGQTIPERDNAYFVGAGPGFFTTLRIDVLSGREFTDLDSANAPAVAIVNDTFARRHFAGRNPVGQRLSANIRGRRRAMEIVAVVRNTNAAGLRAAPPPTVYVPYAQLTDSPTTTLVIRGTEPLEQVASALRHLVQSKMTGTAVEVRAMSAQVRATIVQERMMAMLAGGFGLLAVTLACVGLYGLLAYSVARRTKEIGIRMALGARGGHVIAGVLTSGARLVLIGIALGVPAAWAASSWVKSMLFGLTPTDPATIGGAVVLLSFAALVAAYMPARRASRVDPLTALRHD